MNNVTRKIAAVAMAFAVLGTGAAVTNTIAPKSNNTLTAYAIGGDQDYASRVKPVRGWTYGRYKGKRAGDGIYWIQAVLNKMYRNASGFEALDVDGQYGPKTEAAVKMFQQWYKNNRNSNMLVDGVFGTQTYDAFAAMGYTAGK